MEAWFGAPLQKKHDGVNIFPVAMFVRKLLAGTLKPRIQFLTSGDRWSLCRSLTLGQIWEKYCDKKLRAIDCDQKYFRAKIVCFPKLKNRGMHISTKFRIFWKLILFDHEDIDLGSPKLHVTKFFNQSTFRKNVEILAFVRAEMARGTDSAPTPTLTPAAWSWTPFLGAD